MSLSPCSSRHKPPSMKKKMPREPLPMEICKGSSDLDKVVLRQDNGWSAEVYLYGAHVTSWKNDRGEELLFMSSKVPDIIQEPLLHENITMRILGEIVTLCTPSSSQASFKPANPIRGGIPICFPQYLNLNFGGIAQHGFARLRTWAIDSNPPPLPMSSCGNKAFVDLILASSQHWPHSYEFRLRISLGFGGGLMLTSRIKNANTNGKPFSFTFAYLSYFNVSDAGEVRVEGFETLDFLDNLKDRERYTEQEEAVTFEDEVDRVYLNTPNKINVIDHQRKRTYVIRKDGLQDAIVWNPWENKAKKMLDLGKDEYKLMVSVGAAHVEKPVTLRPGEEWTGRMEITCVGSSYCSSEHLDCSELHQS